LLQQNCLLNERERERESTLEEEEDKEREKLNGRPRRGGERLIFARGAPRVRLVQRKASREIFQPPTPLFKARKKKEKKKKKREREETTREKWGARNPLPTRPLRSRDCFVSYSAARRRTKTKRTTTEGEEEERCLSRSFNDNRERDRKRRRKC